MGSDLETKQGESQEKSVSCHLLSVTTSSDLHHRCPAAAQQGLYNAVPPAAANLTTANKWHSWKGRTKMTVKLHISILKKSSENQMSVYMEHVKVQHITLHWIERLGLVAVDVLCLSSILWLCYSHLVLLLSSIFRWQRWTGGAPKAPPHAAWGLQRLKFYLFIYTLIRILLGCVFNRAAGALVS